MPTESISVGHPATAQKQQRNRIRWRPVISCTVSQLRSSILSPTTPKPFSWFIFLPILSYRPLIIAHLNQHWACTPIHPCQLYPHKITTPSLSLPGKSWLAFIGALLVFPATSSVFRILSAVVIKNIINLILFVKRRLLLISTLAFLARWHPFT